MSSHIQRLPSGRFRIRWIDEFGKRRSETFKSEVAAKSAVKHRHVEVDKVRAGVARPRSDQTLTEASKQWIDSRKPVPGTADHIARQRNNRVRDNQAHLDHHILPALGHYRLPQITSEVIKKFIHQLEAKPTSRPGETNEIKRTLKPATIANVLITLRKMMNDLGYPLRISYKVPESDYGWIKSKAHVAMFLDQCKTPWFRTACELAVYAGLRVGEVAGLRWDRVDF